MKKSIGVSFSAIFFFMLLQFQNCSRVTLEPPEDPPILAKTKGDALLCLPDGYTLESFYVVNLNHFLNNENSQLDSDSDGLSDLEEIKYGFDPLNRRSNGKVLDRICYDQFGSLDACENLTITCSNSKIVFGLNDCDLAAAGLSEIPGKNKGVDSDSDGILDAIEILRGTLPLRQDALEDPDHDRILNRQEIAEGTNPNSYFLDSPNEYLIKSSANLNGEQTSQCSGESWTLTLRQVPVFAINEYISETEPELSHQKNENIIWLIGHLKAKIGNAPPQFLFNQFLADKDTGEKKLIKSDFEIILPTVDP